MVIPVVEGVGAENRPALVLSLEGVDVSADCSLPALAVAVVTGGREFC